MSALLCIPKLGLTMTEAVVGDWLVQPGDNVEAGQALVEIETDKIVHTVVAPVRGVVSTMFAATGDTLPVAAPLCEIE